MAGWAGGVFTRARNWVTDKNGAVNPQAALFDQEDDNFALGLNNCVTKDGQSVPSGSLLWPAASINSLNSLTTTQATIGTLTASGTSALTGAVTIAQILSLTGSITPAAFGATQNDWAPASISTATRVKMSATIASHLTGISAGQTDGRVLFLYNNGGFTITLDHDSASSAAANRFYYNSATNASLPNFATAILVYDGTLSRWLVHRT